SASERKFRCCDVLQLDHACMEDVDGVAFAEQEVVICATVWLKAQKSEEEGRHDVGTRHRAAEMTALRGRDRNDVAAQRRRPQFKVTDRGVGLRQLSHRQTLHELSRTQ